MSIDASGANLSNFVFVSSQDETKKRKSEMYFDRLNESIGKLVVCDFISENTVQTLTGILEEVTNYQSVIIDGKELTFIGKNIAIKTIRDVEFPSFNFLLYYNTELQYTYNGEDMQKERIMIRNKNNFEWFISTWVRLEKVYFKHFNIKESSDIVINTSFLNFWEVISIKSFY